MPKEDVVPGELMNIKQAAAELGVVPSTIHRHLNDGIIAGEQLTPGAPWRMRLTNELKARFNANAGQGCLPMREAIRALGVSRQTVLQRVKRVSFAEQLPSHTRSTVGPNGFAVGGIVAGSRLGISTRVPG
jgi:predicted DNA-binding transcriptional regulator AlpA